MNVQAFIDSLWIMLKGMAGIFIVTVVIALAMYLLAVSREKKQIIIVNAIRARRAAEAVAKTYRISGRPGNLSGRPLIFYALRAYRALCWFFLFCLICLICRGAGIFMGYCFFWAV